MKQELENIKKKLQSGFYGFWVTRWRTTFLVIFLMIILGLFSAIQIPKESSPTIKFGMISIVTVYPGVNPQDMDTLVTEKIENEVKDIKGIKKLSSTSSLGVASTVIELENGVDTTKALSDIKSAVDKASLPSDAQDPMVTDISSDNENMFSVLLYGNSSEFSSEYLKDKALDLKKSLDGKGNISKVTIDGTAEYEIYVLIDKAKADSMGISLLQISQAISAFNKNQPLGNHSVGDLSYDFRVDGELSDKYDLLKIPLANSNGSSLKLGDIATIEKRLKDERQIYQGSYNHSGNISVLMKVNKKPGSNIISTAKFAKNLLNEELKKQDYQGLSIAYVSDMADMISQDYNDLFHTGLETILLVFLSILLFVGFKEALIGSVTVPLSFFITFFVLNKLGMSLNFLTNFSLILCFGIAIDATIVVIQGAHERIRQGFNPKSAVLLSVRDYNIPLISGTLVTVVVFLPLFSLPGIMGKFLAYIPITIFVTLLASLFISLTLNSAMYYKLNKPHPDYDPKSGDIDHMSKEDLLLLEEERKGKTEQLSDSMPRRERMLDRLASWYSEKAGFIMKSPRTRIVAILLPLVCLILSFFVLSPFIGFKLFPSGDNENMTLTITAKKGTTTEKMTQLISGLDLVLSKVPEIKNYYYIVDNNVVTSPILLFKKEERKRDSFTIEKDINQKLLPLAAKGLKVESSVQAGGPPSSKAVGIKLVADSNDKFSELLTVAKDFEKYLHTIKGTKNIAISSSDNPGQFVFEFDWNKLALLGIKPGDLTTELYADTNGIGAGYLKGIYDNHTIKVRYGDYVDSLSPTDVENISVPTMAGKVKIGSVSTYSFDNAVSQISRQDTKIIVKVESDVEEGYSATSVQPQFVAFANTYTFPQGITFEQGGENQDNADLIQAMGVAFVIALFLIFGILVLQFNSYTQSILILYSVVMGLFGANIGLFVTNNPYSLSFMIGFIALTGIVVNHVIVFIDRINLNIDKGMSMYDAVVETGKSRLHPVLLTTVSAVVGLFSIARQDVFFAGLGYTIIFGLIIATIMTLFVLPALYYDKEKIINLIKRTLISFAIWAGIPFAIILVISLVFMFFGISLWSYSWFGLLVFLGYVFYLIKYQKHTIKSWTTTGQTLLQKYTHTKVTDMDGKPLSKYLAKKRSLIRVGLLLIPFVAAALLSGLLSLFGASGLFGMFAFIFFMVYAFWNVYVLWTSEYNQFLHDIICNTKVDYLETQKKND